ncbi:MAG: VWA domain-containing protein [Phycisphaerales bacterium]|nr:VWA domain-containing protein [Phycisphaerales bacterium]
MTGIIAAAVAVPLLLALYFLKLRRRPVRVSATFLWQQASRDMQANVPLRWLRFNWLLLLQLLALACLVFAAARPTIPSADGVGGAKTVLLIDASGSMAALDGDRAFRTDSTQAAAISRLDEAKGRALRAIDELDNAGGGGRRRMMVVKFAASASALTGMTDDTTALREAVLSVTQTDQTGDPFEALKLIGTLTRKPENELSEEAFTPTNVLAFSDGDVGRFEDTPQRQRELAGAMAGLSLKLVRCGTPSAETSANNLGIVSLNARRDYEDPAVVRVFARIVNASAEAKSTQVSISVDGRVAERRAVTIPKGTADKPGELGVTFELNESKGGVMLVRLLDEDLLSSDNAAGVVVGALSPARVLVIGPGEGEPNTDRILLAALDVHKPAKLDVVSASQAAGIFSGPQEPGRGIGYDLVIFDRVESVNPPRVASLHFAKALSVTAPKADSGSEGERVAIMPTVMGGENAEPDRMLSWQREHPLLKYVSLETIIMSPPTVLKLPNSTEASRAGWTVETLASAALGPQIALVNDRGLTRARAGAGGGALGVVPRVVVAFELEKSNWGPHFSFPIFLGNVLDVMAGRGGVSGGRLGWAFSTVDAVTVTPPTGAGGVLEVKNAAGEVVQRIEGEGAEALESDGRLNLSVIPRAGLYVVSRVAPGGANVGEIGAPGIAAVNMLSEGESLVRTHAEMKLSSNMPPVKLPIGAAAEGGREIWNWFVLAAVVLLTLEWLLYAWLMKA